MPQKISVRLLLAFAIVLLFVAGLGYSSLRAIGQLGAALDEATNITSKKLVLVGDLQAGFQEMRADAAKLEISQVNTLIGRIDNRRGTAETPCITCHTLDTVDSQKAKFEKTAAGLSAQVAQLRPMVASEQGRQAVHTVEAGIVEWRALYMKYLELTSGRDYTAAHEVMLDRIYPLVDSVDKAANELAKRQQQQLSASSQEAHARISSSRMVAYILIALCLVAGAGVQWVVRGVNRLLREFAGEMAVMSREVSSAASQLADSSLSLAQGASEQASSLQETAASTEEVSSTTRSNAGHCQTACAVTTTVAQQVEQANESLGEMIGSMHEINISSGKISQIIKVIDEIAFQTNILALNAAVEAARAGEAGLGFAMVADEVRNLSQRCSQAARDTGALIEESITRSREGSAKLDRVATAVRAITESATEVKGLIGQVNSGGLEQARGIEHISRALGEIDQVTQRTAASAEENAAAGKELSTNSEALRNVVEKLSALV